MYRILFYLLFLAILLAPAGTASAVLPDNMSSRDIIRVSDGNPPAGTGSDYDGAGTFTVTGAGRDIWDDRDNFQYCYLQASGDMEIVARVVSITGGSHEWAKCGVMIRETLDPESAHRFMALTNTTGTDHAAAYQGRNSTGGGSNSNHGNEQPSPYNLGDPLWVRLVRSSDVFTGYFSTDGENWTEQTGSQTAPMGADVYVGLAVTSHDNSFTVTGTFDNVLLNGEFPGKCMAHDPDPGDGTYVAPEYWEENVYMILDFIPGSCTEGYYSEGFFSTDKALVDAMAPSASLGTVPPWPTVDLEAWVVGYDDPGIPEHARTPLVPGTTYYWSTASFDGTEWWPSSTWSFTPIPKQAWNPDPEDGAGLVPNNGTMTWSLGDLDTTGLTLTYDVYIGTDETAVADANVVENPSVPEYMGNVGMESYDYADLEGETEIFWRVDTKLAITRPPFTATYTTGDVWSFTTLPEIPDVNIVEEDLIGWWKLDGDIVAYWIFDSSGYANHGVAHGDPTFVPGHIDNALDFDGVDDYVGTGKSLLSGIAQFTLAGWVSAGNPETGRIGLFGQNDAVELGFQGGDIHMWTSGGGEARTAWTYGTDTWHHVAVVGNGTNLVIYVDGQSVVTGGTVTTNYGTSSFPFNIGGGGIWDATGNWFAGQMDDVRAYERALSANEVRILAGLVQASNPDPANGATDVPRTPTLSWSPGAFAAAVNGSVVYYSEDISAVADRTAPSATLSTPPFTLPMTLDLGTTFYWAVDTVNGVETWPGDLWSFTTVDWLPVDDMESYVIWSNPVGPHIFTAWRDGFGDCTPGNGNDTGSVLTENPSPVLAGIQSMKYDFDNDGIVYSPCTMGNVSGRIKYSRIEAQTATLPSGIGSDWTLEGVKALSLPFHGQAGNATTESLWVQLQDGTKGYGEKVFYGTYEGESLDDFNEASWHEWHIDLNDFDVDLTNVVSIVIGIGDEAKDTAYGSGTLYFDEIRLYTPSCRPQRAKPAADFDNSCKVDYPDVAALFDVWLLRDIPETAWSGTWQSTDIGDVNLPGSFFDLGGGSYSITGRGADIWGESDSFHYAYKPLSGDGQMTVRVTGIAGPSANDWRKAGIMIRETLDPNSSHAFMCVTPAGGGGSSFQWRPTTGSGSSNQDGPAGVETPECIRLVRVGDQFRAFRYVNGEWTQAGSPVTVPMVENVYIGLAVTSHEANFSCTTTFDRVCSDDFVPMDLLDDSVINFEDYGILMNQWQDEVFWP